MLAAHFHECFIRALYDALATDVDPRACRHLAIHHQPLAVEFAEVLPGRPMRYEVGVSDEHARRVSVGSEDADWLARLYEQSFVLAQGFQGFDDVVVTLPIAR